MDMDEKIILIESGQYNYQILVAKDASQSIYDEIGRASCRERV